MSNCRGSDSLVVLDDILYREWISSNFKTKVLQLLVPRNYVNTVLEDSHDSPSGSHFGVNKTLQKIRKDFIGLLVKKMLKIGILFSLYCKERSIR